MPALLLEAGPIRILHHAGSDDALIIAFASIGHDPAQPPSPEFIRTATAGGHSALFVTDASRSWGSAPEFFPALTAAVARLSAARILTLGQSMGGYCALAAAGVLQADAALAISPQYRPEADPRWEGWTARLEPAHLPRLELPSARHSLICHGMTDDLPLARAFPQVPGCDHLLFTGHGHSTLAPHLRQAGVLPGAIAALLAGDRRRLLRIMSSAGGISRRRVAISEG